MKPWPITAEDYRAPFVATCLIGATVAVVHAGLQISSQVDDASVYLWVRSLTPKPLDPAVAPAHIVGAAQMSVPVADASPLAAGVLWLSTALGGVLWALTLVMVTRIARRVTRHTFDPRALRDLDRLCIVLTVLAVVRPGLWVLGADLAFDRLGWTDRIYSEVPYNVYLPMFLAGAAAYVRLLLSRGQRLESDLDGVV